jgi:DNA-binding MarR family transcriptional regulator
MLQNHCREVYMTDPIRITDDEVLWENIFITSITLQRARELELAQVGLTMAQAGVLYQLKIAKEPMTPMKISRRMHKQPHTISALVTRMEADGLLKTAKDLERKNWVRVSLTKKGQEAFNRQITQKLTRNVTSCLSKKEKDAIAPICNKLRAHATEMIRQMLHDPYSDLLI